MNTVKNGKHNITNTQLLKFVYVTVVFIIIGLFEPWGKRELQNKKYFPTAEFGLYYTPAYKTDALSIAPWVQFLRYTFIGKLYP